MVQLAGQLFSADKRDKSQAVLVKKHPPNNAALCHTKRLDAQ